MVQGSGTYRFPDSAKNPAFGNIDCILVLEGDPGKNIQLKVGDAFLCVFVYTHEVMHIKNLEKIP